MVWTGPERVTKAADLVEPIAPGDGTWFITKARHSIFYETQLAYLLREQGIERIVLVGQVTEQCILYSALDAYVRHFAVAVPRDAVTGIHEDLDDAALRMMERNMRADVAEAEDTALSEGTRRRVSPARHRAHHDVGRCEEYGPLRSAEDEGAAKCSPQPDPE